MASKPARSDFVFLRKIVHARSQNVLDPARDYVFEARLAKLVRSRGMSSVADLVNHLRNTRDEALEAAVADAMTINETTFFRDGRPFELLHRVLLPELIEARRITRSLRLWSAGCSTGQEAYSLAMLLREHASSLANWKIRVEATDICADVVKRAEAGRYQRIEVNRGLPARYLARYFEPVGEDWIVKPEVRGLCHFHKANLCSPLPFRERFDVIFLRNVMLYLGQESRRAVLAAAHRLLAPDGVLCLGASEQPADTSLWTSVLAGGTCYYRPRAS
ncbi:MAG TPA: protein-glutamate O-methyltransferase CheR [Terracidiphilus sp.]|nr:protein-glutamate O-methyltransferase CheR [Terracidiphilus sp.]